MTDYPETIIAKVDYDGTFDGQWVDRSASLPPDMDAGHEYVRADLYNVLLTEKHADAECIGSLRAEKERLREALQQLVSCPAVLDEDWTDPEWGCPETAAAEGRARHALATLGS